MVHTPLVLRFKPSIDPIKLHLHTLSIVKTPVRNLENIYICTWFAIPEEAKRTRNLRSTKGMYSRSVESMCCRLRLYIYISVRSGVKCKGRYTPLLISIHWQPHAQPTSHRLKSICSGRECMLRISNNLNNVYAYLWQWTKNPTITIQLLRDVCTLYQISHTRRTTEFPCH